MDKVSKNTSNIKIPDRNEELIEDIVIHFCNVACKYFKDSHRLLLTHRLHLRHLQMLGIIK
jgi:hypothetical protein